MTITKNNILKINQKSITKGTYKETFNVNMPVYYVTWHTHPAICYQKNACYIGWPSGVDMGQVFRYYSYGLIFHLIFAAEGTYSIRLTSGLMALSRVLDNYCLDLMEQLITIRFSSLENFRSVEFNPDTIDCLQKINDIRCFTYDNQKQRESIQDIVNFINNFTLEELIQFGKTIEFEDIEEIEFAVSTALENIKKSPYYPSVFPDVPIFFTDFTAEKKDQTISVDFLIAPEMSICPLVD